MQLYSSILYSSVPALKYNRSPRPPGRPPVCSNGSYGRWVHRSERRSRAIRSAKPHHSANESRIR